MPHGRPHARVSFIVFDDQAYPDAHLALDASQGLRPGAHVWIWIAEQWHEALVQETGPRKVYAIYVRMVTDNAEGSRTYSK